MTVGSRTVSASEMAARWPASRDSNRRTATPATPTETWAERLYAALPLFIVGGACLAVAVDFYYSGVTKFIFGNSTVRLAPWTLFLALAVTGLAAGTFALIMEDEEVPVAEPAPVAAKPASTPPWDESALAPSKPAVVRPRTWEQHPMEPEDFVGWSPNETRVEHVSPDVVLVQIDEIAASLRKKPPPSSPPS